MFRALLCPSSGALDYMCVIASYGVQCLVAGCRGSGAGQQGVRPGRGMLEEKPTRWHYGLLHLWYAQHVSGTSMPIIRSSRLYVLLPPMMCSAWLLVVGGQVQSSRLCVQEEGCCTTWVVPVAGNIMSAHVVPVAGNIMSALYQKL